MLSLDWHGLKNFKDFEDFANVSFLNPNSQKAPKKKRRTFIYANQFDMTPIYIFRFCVFEVLFACLT